ncbi:MAG: glycoside hydrolase family 97 N-terminal domain-containing protein, partial [Muribaculaceae bacterium]|nr:glycoside hydrolase family 97 N-terminal domain-containing protein [Muribaculaceae bacterium]
MKRLTITTAAITLIASLANAFNITSPDGKLDVNIDLDSKGQPQYNVTLDGKTMLRNSPLGFTSNIGDYTKAKTMKPGEITPIEENYSLDRIKKSDIEYHANEATVKFVTPDGLKWGVTFRVSNNDVAFRYNISKAKETGSIYIDSESTGFRFPAGTTTFLTPQSDPMIGWKRTKPSYEEYYSVDA